VLKHSNFSRFHFLGENKQNNNFDEKMTVWATSSSFGRGCSVARKLGAEFQNSIDPMTMSD